MRAKSLFLSTMILALCLTGCASPRDKDGNPIYVMNMAERAEDEYRKGIETKMVETKQAATTCQQEASPENIKALQDKIQCLVIYGTGDETKAHDEFSRASAGADKYAIEGMRALADCYVKSGNLLGARDTLRAAIVKFSPKEHCKGEVRDIEFALEDLNKMIEAKEREQAAQAAPAQPVATKAKAKK